MALLRKRNQFWVKRASGIYFSFSLNWYVTLALKWIVDLLKLFKSFKAFILRISILKLNLEDVCFLSAFSYRGNGVEGKKINLGD